ncbi:hypothetical protein GDN83_05825 [Gordonia jinghuaiqii]|uniref:Uncharacterized protein n=1 Tax=Gordonia jinghuaiqii TaxID=2758710 RepID=A0A7D7LS60_9ACTN|nr:hypothetical protein [Gordonia jinghuaiqii]MCR5977266.1 hypothetical protein [Gordonia jinghuaiqii]QMT00141.1 hypothetical protein H1R19_14510 [Gordonia jinghuaiqii]
MLTLALAATLIGFVLLILGLITGTVWLAVACIVICLIGLAFLLVDVFSGRRNDAGRSLEDMVPGAGRDDESGAEPDDHAADSVRGDRSQQEADETRRHSVAGEPAVEPRRDGSRDAEATYEPPSFEPGMAAPTGSDTPSRPAPERREGNLEDYLRSVGADDVPRPSTPGPRAPYGAPGPQPPGAQQFGAQQFGTQQFGTQPQDPRQSGARHGGPQPPRPVQPRPQQWSPPQSGPQQSGPQQSAPQLPSPQQSGQDWGQPPLTERPRNSRPGDPPSAPRDPEGTPADTDAAGRPENPSSGRRRAAKFDPLDPNWHPPAD